MPNMKGRPMAGSATPAPIVLVVEDEFLIRMNVVEIIEDAGFRALEAANADEAIALLETHPNISVVFTDIDMPGSMNGIRLAQAVRGRWPPIKIIATSGHFRLRDGDLPHDGRFLPKPYSSDQITTTIRELMAA
jgi:CheY-like chemotaxis protein